MVKIGYFTEKFPYLSLKNEAKIYPYGGGEIVAYNLALNIAKRGHGVYVFTTSADFKYSVENNCGVVVDRYATILKVFRRNISFDLIFKPNVDIDVVHVHICSEPFSLIAGLRLAKKMNVPLVATYHGDTICSSKNVAYKIATKFHNNIIENVLKRSDIIITPSRYYITESKILRKYNYKITEIPNGIYFEKYDIKYSQEKCRQILNLPLNKDIILFVGGLYPHKGPDVLLRAIYEIIKTEKFYDVELVFVGRGLLQKLQHLCSKLNIEKYVRFTGYIDENIKPLYYKASDIFCLPSVSRTEVFPVVLLEASASGLPMIVSNLNTFKIIVENNYNGLYAKINDPKDLANKILYLLNNKKLRLKMSKKAKIKVMKFSWTKIAERVEKLYLNLLSKRM